MHYYRDPVKSFDTTQPRPCRTAPLPSRATTNLRPRRTAPVPIYDPTEPPRFRAATVRERSPQSRHYYQLVYDPSGRFNIGVNEYASLKSPICCNFDVSTSTPNPGRSFGHSFPFFKS